MAQPVGALKTGLILLLGVATAPLLKPLLKTTLKASVKAGLRVKELAEEASLELKVLAAEAVQETVAATNGTGSDISSPAP